MGFTNITTINKIIVNNQDSFKEERLKSIPTETKNKTAKMSLIGSASDVALALKSDCPTTIPAKNAPNAIDAPKNSVAQTEIPNAITRTERMKSSLFHVLAICSNKKGITFLPTIKAKATKTASLETVITNVKNKL